MTALDETPNDLFNAVLGHMAFGGKAFDAGPGVTFLLVDEIGEHKGQHEGERRQFGVGAHLIEPDEFFVCKGGLALRPFHIMGGALISFDPRTGIEKGRAPG